MKIALTYNLRPAGEIAPTAGWDDTYAEWDEPATIDAVRAALAAEHEVVLIEGHRRVEERLLAAQPDVVFNLAEGWKGPHREASIPALLESWDIPFTGSSSHTLRLCLDKAAAKQALRRHGLPTPAYTVIQHPGAVPHLHTFPMIVKPVFEGSSKGIYGESVVSTRPELVAQVQRIITTYDQPALVETFLPGREFTVALLGNGRHVQALPVVEICFTALQGGVVPVYSYEAKWLWDTPEHPLEIFACPAKVGPEFEHRLVELCRRAFRVLGCRDWCRIDVRLDAAGHPHILEINPLPGILPDPQSHSCFPKAAAAAGMTYAELIQQVLRLACQRYGLSVMV